jgi:hypothetical protein
MWSIININISQAPKDLESIPDLLGKTFCLRADKYTQQSVSSICLQPSRGLA